MNGTCLTNQPRIPDPETRARLLSSLRQTRLQLEEFGLQLEEIIAGLEKHIREQKLQRIANTKQNFPK